MIRGWTYSHVQPAEETTDFRPDHEHLLWIEAIDATEAELDGLAVAMNLDHHAAEDLKHGGQRTKLDSYGDHWHVALHDARFDGSELVPHELDFVFGTNWILIVHHHADDSLLGVMRTRFDEHRLHGSRTTVGFALWATLDVIVDDWFSVADTIDEKLDEIEGAVFNLRLNDLPEEAFKLRRSLLTFRKLVTPTRDVLNTLVRGDTGLTDEVATGNLRDVHDHSIRLNEIIDLQREILTGLLEAHLSIVSNRMNEVMKATSSWGAILVLNTLIAGIYGMNFRHMPELHWLLGYPLSLTMMLVITFGGYRVFRRRGWL